MIGNEVQALEVDDWEYAESVGHGKGLKISSELPRGPSS
jgi:hypothetical protein